MVVVVVVVLIPIVVAAIVDLFPLNGSSISGSLFACFHFHLLYCICVCVCVFCSTIDKHSHNCGIVIYCLIIKIVWRLIGLIFQGSYGCFVALM